MPTPQQEHLATGYAPQHAYGQNGIQDGYHDNRGYAGRPNMPGPPTEDFMNSIREVAVFAWALTGINGSLAQYSRGRPKPGATPFGGMPIWDPSHTGERQETMNVGRVSCLSICVGF